MKIIISSIIFLFISTAIASPGDTIDIFTLPDQPIGGVRGLAKDWSDGNIFAAGPRYEDHCVFCKFHLDDHHLVKDWVLLAGCFRNADIGYPYHYSGYNVLVVMDDSVPRVKLFNSTNGNYIGYLDDPFNQEFTEGVGANPNNNFLYATNNNLSECKEWDGTQWSTFATYSESNNAGVAYGWGCVFVIFSHPIYKIKVFNESGEFIEEYSLNNWGTGYISGISCAHEDIIGNNESLFVSITYPSNIIKEVEVGNFYEEAIENLSVGMIRAVFQ